MDRRQQKTRAAIFAAFSALLAEKSYGKITVQEIIDRANIGRTTFYAHFGTKDDLLAALCKSLFGHIISSAEDASHTHGLKGENGPEWIFRHLLQHLREDDMRVLELLSCESRDMFLRCFKDSLNGLIETLFADRARDCGVPHDFLVNHITGSFVEMVLWWIKGHMKESPEELDRYFRIVMEPVLRNGPKKD